MCMILFQMFTLKYPKKSVYAKLNKKGGFVAHISVKYPSIGMFRVLYANPKIKSDKL